MREHAVSKSCAPLLQPLNISLFVYIIHIGLSAELAAHD